MSQFRIFWLILFFSIVYLIYLLSPILTPFIAAIILAYLGDPLVDKLEKIMPRMWAVTLVFLCLFIFFVLVIMVLIPFLSGQISNFISKLPDYTNSVKSVLMTHFPQLFVDKDVDSISNALQEHIGEVSKFINNFFKSLGSSANIIITWISYLVLIPVVTFYLLRDWDEIIAKISTLLPLAHKAIICELVKKSDDVLGAFLRGQLMVMIGLGFLYAIGLKIVGIDLAITIGLFAGFISFVPYLGLIVGIILASGMAFVQFHDWSHILGVGITFVIAQTIESTILTPKFVGNSIGIHPVMVLFAVLAGGQLFGFMGILLALPVAAILNVICVYYLPHYFKSNFYRKIPINLKHNDDC